ncbi:MAG: beta-ketoacyl-ACP synthase II [bacterium]
MSAKRVVVTGMGAVTPLGIGIDSFWQSIVDCKSGATTVTGYDTTDHVTTIACEIKEFDASNWIDRKTVKHMDRFVQFAAVASKFAIEDSGLEITDEISDEVGVIIGSGIGGMSTLEKQHTALVERGPNRVSPYMIPMLISDMASGMVSIEHNAKGPNMSIVTACASAAHSIGEAAEMIRRGAMKVAITGGAEATITPFAMSGFGSMKAMSTRNEDPATASRPFDKTRDGFVMGEGAGVIILEEYEFAKARGAKIYGELIGYGATGDAYHITSPESEGRGAAKAMQMALRQAGISPEEISYINAHGTSTPTNDRVETMAVKSVFGDAAYKIPMSSTKSMTGHLLGASGAIELIICLKAMNADFLPATINYSEPDPECDLDCIPNTPRQGKIKYAMSNSFGFGGHNGSLIVGKI